MDTSGRGPALLAALVASALACSTAAAQLPEASTPSVPSPAAQPAQSEPLEPLPSPVEEVVEESPLATVREEAQRLLGGGGSDPGGGGDPTGTTAGGAGSAPGQAGAGALGGGADAPAAGGGSPAVEPGGGSPAAGGGGPGPAAGGPAVGADDAGAGPGGAAPRGARDGAPARSGDEADRDAQGSPLARTVNRIVEVVPAYVWVALGVLLIAALALALRARIDNCRARALRRERERLLRDVGLLERALLPEVPERLGELSASVAYRPAGGPAAGGDFYDAFELPGDRVAVLVGDVSGHGPAALERTGSLRPTLHAHLQAGLSPRAALEAAARTSGADADGSFATVVVALHDPASGTLTYAAAGHPPPIVVGPGAREAITAASAPPLGLGIRTGVRQTTLPLPRGSTACFFTDGLLEARLGGRLVGRERLTELLVELGPDEPAAALLDRLEAGADETPDDMTVCLLRAPASSGAVAPRLEELEIEAGELDAGTAERFLAACGVPEDATATALADARRVSAGAGAALLAVTIDAAGASVSVTPPAPEALATT